MKRLKFSRSVPAAVKKGISDAFKLYRGKHVQNNASETENSVLQSMLSLKGNHSLDKLARRIRTFYTIKNNNLTVPASFLSTNHGPAVLFTRIFNMDYRTVLRNMKTEVSVVGI